MRILVISDLHIGLKARTKELCPYPTGVHKDDQLVSSFLKWVKEYRIREGKLDYLVMPGDITHQSNLIEYDYGQRFLEKLQNELSLSIDKIVFVPGNHDVDWSVVYGDTIHNEEKPYRLKQKFNALGDNSHIFSKLTNKKLTEPPYLRKWEFSDVVFFGFNSSWDDDALQTKHFGNIEMNQIHHLREEIENTDLRNKLKIFVVHHHVLQYANPHPTWKDISIMQNSQPLIEMLSEFSFNFVIHGHRHVPNFMSTNINNGNTMNILCSGSYSCEVPSEISGSVSNLFHIIETDDDVLCKGRVLSLAYDSTKYSWVNSKENHGIEYENAFGVSAKYETMLMECLEIVKTNLENNSYYEYAELLITVPELKYISNTERRKLLSEIESMLDLRKVSMVSRETVFIKKKR